MGTCEFDMIYSSGCPRATTQLKILKQMVADYPSQITLRTYDVDNPTEKQAARSERPDAYNVYYNTCKMKTLTTSLYRGGKWIYAWCGERTSDTLLGGCSGIMAPTSIRKLNRVSVAPTQLTAATGGSALNISVDVRTYQPGNE